MNSVYVHLLVTITIIDFHTCIKKMPLTRDRWTGTQQLRTGYRSASGCASNHPGVALDSEIL